MLKAQELRIGNLISFMGNDGFTSIQPVVGISADGISVISHEYFLFNEDLIPIELTEEILLKFGFVDNGLSFSGCKIYEIGVFRLFYHKLNKTYALGHQQMSPPSTVFADLYYLHQLQNLYFALTGKELNTSELL